MSNLILSSAKQVADMLIKHPSLTTIPPFQALKEGAKAVVAAKGCKCNQNAASAKYKTASERAFTSLTSEHRKQIKNAVGVDQICYYVKNARGNLELKCF